MNWAEKITLLSFLYAGKTLPGKRRIEKWRKLTPKNKEFFILHKPVGRF
jgi:hypothetical protein